MIYKICSFIVNCCMSLNTRLISSYRIRVYNLLYEPLNAAGGIWTHDIWTQIRHSTKLSHTQIFWKWFWFPFNWTHSIISIFCALGLWLSFSSERGILHTEISLIIVSSSQTATLQYIARLAKPAHQRRLSVPIPYSFPNKFSLSFSIYIISKILLKIK